MGKLRKESSPDNDDHFRPTYYNSPPRSPTSLVEIWRGHDSLSLRQRNPPSRPVAARGRQYWGRGIMEEGLLFEFAALGTAVPHFFLHFALVQGRHDLWVVRSFSFICFPKGP
jgi:hypothetical protein